MKESMRKKWMPMMGVFLAVFGSFAALMYLSIKTFSGSNRSGMSSFYRFDQTDRQTVASQAAKQSSSATVSHSANISKLILELGRRHAVGKAVLTYRGMEGRSTFRLDVLVPELDAQYTYPHKINIDQARKGFQVGGEQLKLISAGRSKIRFSRQVPRR